MSPMELKRTSRMVSTRPMYRRVARPRQSDESGPNSSESEQRFATTGTTSWHGTSFRPDALSPAEKHSLGRRRGRGARRAPAVPRATGVLRAAGGAWGRCPGPTAPTALQRGAVGPGHRPHADRKSTRLNSSHITISYAVFCLKKKKKQTIDRERRENHP